MHTPLQKSFSDAWNEWRRKPRRRRLALMLAVVAAVAVLPSTAGRPDGTLDYSYFGITKWQ